ncbi:MAG: hypothetical protein WKH64_01815 [Chloroflexia bacterium]
MGASRCVPSLAAYSLSGVAEAFNADPHAHDAVADADSSRKVFLALSTGCNRYPKTWWRRSPI